MRMFRVKKDLYKYFTIRCKNIYFLNISNYNSFIYSEMLFAYNKNVFVKFHELNFIIKKGCGKKYQHIK